MCVWYVHGCVHAYVCVCSTLYVFVSVTVNEAQLSQDMTMSPVGNSDDLPQWDQ